MQRQVINEPPRVVKDSNIQSGSQNPNPANTNMSAGTGLTQTKTPRKLQQRSDFSTQTQPPPPESPVQNTSIAVGTADLNKPPPIGNLERIQNDSQPQPENFESKQNEQKEADLVKIRSLLYDPLWDMDYKLMFPPMAPGNPPGPVMINSFLEDSWQDSPEGWASNNNERLQVNKDPNSSSFEDKIGEGFPDGLSSLKATRHFFIQPKPPSFGHEQPSFKRKFDILDTNGERLFIAAETKGTRNYVRCGRKLNLTVLGSNGSEMFKFSWNGGKAAEHSTKSVKSGKIEELAAWCSSESYFRIKDSSGKVIYKILHNWSNKCYYEFDVFTPAPTRTRIGKVSKTWIGLPHPDQHLAHLYGISFLAETPLVDKTSLLVAAFLLYFKFVEDKNLDRRRRENNCLYLILYFLIIMAFFLLLALFAGYTYRQSSK